MNSAKLTTEEVRDVFASQGGDETYRLFDKWLKSVQAEAYDEALDAMHADGHLHEDDLEMYSAFGNPFRRFLDGA